MHSGLTSSKNQHIVLSSLGFFVLLEMYQRFYTQYPYFLVVGVLLVFFLTWITVVDKVFSKNFALYMSTPLIMFIAFFGFITLTEVPLFAHVASIGTAVLSWIYFHTLYLFNFNYEKFEENGIENVSSYINLISFYLISIILYAAATLVGVPFYILGGVLTLLLLVIGYQSLWAAGLELIKTYVYLIILAIMLLEIFWAVSFLPTNFYVSGFLVAISYYTLWGLCKSHLHSVLSTKVLVRYLVLGVVASLCVVITSVWI